MTVAPGARLGAVAALNHPHICQLYDVGPNDLVMELSHGDHPRHRSRPTRDTKREYPSRPGRGRS